jgi:hypothetical protein
VSVHPQLAHACAAEDNPRKSAGAAAHRNVNFVMNRMDPESLCAAIRGR